MTRVRAAAAAALVALTLAGSLAGCSLALERLPAPSAVSGPSYRLDLRFRDVQTLALGAKVKLGGVAIGEVDSITTRDYVATVGVRISERFPLRTGTRFQIRFSTPLGEDFVSAMEPAQERPPLSDGAVVPLDSTSEAPTIEDAFAALSLLLNGGGLDKLRTIVTELDTALTGRGSTARDVLRRLDAVVASLDDHRADIDRALDGLAELGTRLADGTDVVNQALAQFPQALQLLADDTGRLRRLLEKVGRLGDTVTGLLRRSQDDLLADLDALRPTLDALDATRDQLIPTADSLIRFGTLIRRAAPGDYLNLAVTIQFLFDTPPQVAGRPPTAPAASTNAAAVTALLSGGAR